jgi:hypothetical protein
VSKRVSIWIFGLLAVGAIAGCGSGGSDSTSSLTKAEFVKKADAICTKHHDAIETGFLPYVNKHKGKGKEGEAAGVEAAVHAVMLPELNAQADELGSLGAPSGDEDAISAMLGTFEKSIEEIEEHSSNLASALPAGEKANELAKEFGLNTCMTS